MPVTTRAKQRDEALAAVQRQRANSRDRARQAARDQITRDQTELQQSQEIDQTVGLPIAHSTPRVEEAVASTSGAASVRNRQRSAREDTKDSFESALDLDQSADAHTASNVEPDKNLTRVSNNTALNQSLQEVEAQDSTGAILQIMADPEEHRVITNAEWALLQEALVDRAEDAHNLTDRVNAILLRNNRVEPGQKAPFHNIEPFRGRVTENWSKWLAEFNKLAVACRWDNARKLEILPSLLLDHAAQVYATIPLNDQNTFDNLVRALNAQFNNAEAKRLRATQFHNCRQQMGESSDAFADRLQDLIQEAYPNLGQDDRNRMLLDAFVQNLLPVLKLPVVCSNAQDFQGALAAARRVELQTQTDAAGASSIFAAIPAVQSALLQPNPLFTALQQQARHASTSSTNNDYLINRQPLNDNRGLFNKSLGQEVRDLRTEVRQLRSEMNVSNKTGQNFYQRNRNLSQINRGRLLPQRTQRSFGGQPVCYGCGKPGHILLNCRNANQQQYGQRNYNLQSQRAWNTNSQNRQWGMNPQAPAFRPALPSNERRALPAPNTGSSPNINGNRPIVNALTTDTTVFSDYNEQNIQLRDEVDTLRDQLERLHILHYPDNQPVIGCLIMSVSSVSFSCQHTVHDVERLSTFCKSAILCAECHQVLNYAGSHIVTCQRCSIPRCLLCDHETASCMICSLEKPEQFDLVDWCLDPLQQPGVPQAMGHQIIQQSVQTQESLPVAIVTESQVSKSPQPTVTIDHYPDRGRRQNERTRDRSRSRSPVRSAHEPRQRQLSESGFTFNRSFGRARIHPEHWRRLNSMSNRQDIIQGAIQELERKYRVTHESLSSLERRQQGNQKVIENANRLMQAVPRNLEGYITDIVRKELKSYATKQGTITRYVSTELGELRPYKGKVDTLTFRVNNLQHIVEAVATTVDSQQFKKPLGYSGVAPRKPINENTLTQPPAISEVDLEASLDAEIMQGVQQMRGDTKKIEETHAQKPEESKRKKRNSAQQPTGQTP